jgi:hypothetical protein
MRKTRNRLNVYERSRRYRYLILSIILIWLIIGFIVWQIDPDQLRDLVFPNSYFLMGLLLFIGFFLLLSLLFLSAKHALIWSTAIIIFLCLRLFGLASLYTGIFLFGFLVSFEIYQRQRNSP